MEYSVLLSVYDKERPEHLLEAVESMEKQTAPSKELILVCDGPLTPGLEDVIALLTERYPYWIKPVRLAENNGLSAALNAGLARCSCDLIARMDSDDISLSDRCERQIKVLKSQEYDIVSGTVLEFEGEPGNIISSRVLPENSGEILKFSKRRNPFNHPAVMFRKEAVLKVGGYGECRYFEDYELWTKLLAAGCSGYNIPEPLLKMRAGSNLYARRGGKEYFECIRKFEKFRLNSGVSGMFNYWVCLLGKGAVALAPNFLRGAFYKVFLRKK
ncbi:MAG: glycosyltransferase [Oscillospiraceae bacterium]|nr:glycosyltransferase [Oscillospiraceae bacterium]